MTILEIIFIDKMWNNLAFWHVLFTTTLISLIIIKSFFILNKKAGAFNNYKQYDFGIYKKTSAFFSEDDIIAFLDDLQGSCQYKKTVLQQIGDFESLMSSTSNTYKSEILRKHINDLLKDIGALKRFLVVNFSEEHTGNIMGVPVLRLLPEIEASISGASPQERYAADNDIIAEAQKIMDEKREFYLNKERELKILTQKIRDEYTSYREIVKRYLNV
jgi:hypothetical protein